jgi:hypothetical protein
MRKSRLGRADLPNFPQDFHRRSHKAKPRLSHKDASGLIQSTYTEWKRCGKFKKITQRLHFGYCLGGFRRKVEEKCENPEAEFRD